MQLNLAAQEHQVGSQVLVQRLVGNGEDVRGKGGEWFLVLGI
jgi:hypothetical protein